MTLMRTFTDDFDLITREGRLHWLHAPTGRVFPFVAGGDDNEGGNSGDGDDTTSDADGDGGEGRTFTQAEVDRMTGRARSEAKRAAAKELADELGIDVSQAKAIIAAKNKADDDAKSEAERAAEAAKTAKAQADADRAAAARERFEAKLERTLTKAGVPEKALARALRLVDLEPGADDDAIAAEIDVLKDDVPGLFEDPSGGENGGGERKPPRAPSGRTDAKPPAGGQGTKSALDKGREFYKSTRPQTDNAA